MDVQNDTFVCGYCHNVVVPEKDSSGVAILGDPSDETCPVCRLTLMRAVLGKSPLLYCIKCHGMLIAIEDFQTLIAAARTASAPVAELSANPDELKRIIACPHCNKPMEAHFYAGPGNVVIDTCETCSLNWLDHDELARIAHAHESDFGGDPSGFDSGSPDRDSASF